MRHSDQETVVLDAVLPRLREDGFEVFVKPSTQLLPSFMKPYLPDAIAIRPDRRLAIEVVRNDTSSRSKLDRLRGLFDDQSDWELLVYWVSSPDDETKMARPDQETILISLSEVETLLVHNHVLSALLQGWATFEAAARSLSPQELARPQSSERLIETLASKGQVTPTEADRLRAISMIRNAVAHGDLDASADVQHVRDLVRIVRAMITEAVSGSAN